MDETTVLRVLSIVQNVWNRLEIFFKKNFEKCPKWAL
jgi:hypothetical protein